MIFSPTSPPRPPHVVALPPVGAAGGDVHEVLLTLTELKVDVEVHITVASITLSSTFINLLEGERDCMFEVSLSEGRALVTSATVEHSGKRLETTVISSEAAAATTRKEGGENKALADVSSRFSGGPSQEYSPDVFRLPFTGLAAGATATVTVTYLQDLEFDAGEYIISVPTELPPEMLQEALTWGGGGGGRRELSSVISLRAVLNTGSINCEWGATTHQMIVMESGVSRVVLEGERNTTQMPNCDFRVSYKAWEPDIRGNCIVQKSQVLTEQEKDGSFCVFLSPPEEIPANEVFSRHIVFLLDRSGSMTGTPMTSAIESMITALEELREMDKFAICAFDHEQWWFGYTNNEPESLPAVAMLTQATPSAVDAAIGWISSIQSRGGTNISTPYEAAVNLLAPVGKFLEEIGDLPAAQVDPVKNVPLAAPPLPLVVIITDGAVANERDICRFARDQAQGVRTFTFGIGVFVNKYFLKMLAQIGRGYSAVSLHAPSLAKDMTSLMAKTMTPVLTEVAIGVAGLEDGCEVYPFPVPDLYQKAPLVVAGRFKGRFPSEVWVRGTVPSGEVVNIRITAYERENVPVNKVFERMQLDNLVAKWWLADRNDQKHLKEQVIGVSTTSSMPCPLTSTVAYEVKPEDMSKTPQERQQNFQKQSVKKGGLSGVTAGGVIVVGTVAAVALAFGSTTGTLGNLSALSAMDSLFSNGFGEGFFDSIGDAFADAGEATCDCCQTVWGACGLDDLGESCDGCCAGHENVLDSLFGSCGSCCDGLLDSIGGLFSGCISNVEACGTGCWGCTSDGCQSCLSGEALSGCGNCISNGAGECFDCFTGCITPVTDCFAGILGSTGDCCGSCASNYGSFLTDIDCGGCVGDLGNCAGACLSNIGPCLEASLDIVGSIIGGIGDGF